MNVKLIVMDNIIDLGINVLNNESIVRVTRDRFSNGEGKIKVLDNVNDKDVYILSDVGNYGITYKLHGKEHEMTPDEHFADIKRVIGAISGRARSINVIMPLLYESRQHKRKGHESLDCAIALQELEGLGVDSIITFDAHDPSICNAIPRLPFENIYPTTDIINNMIIKEDIKSPLVISPDMGAMDRARYYADMLGSDVGVFYKRRDLSRVVNGKNPIIEHMYMGSNPKDKEVVIVDDMIASGASMIEVAEMLKEKGASKVYLVATFALFTEGINKFKAAHELGIFDELYTTNLSYIPDELKLENWVNIVDCSEHLSSVIESMSTGCDLEALEEYRKEKTSELVKNRVSNKQKVIK